MGAMKNELHQSVDKALEKLGITTSNGEKPSGSTKIAFKIDYPDSFEHGDFSCNAALVYAKQAKLAPRALADKIVEHIDSDLPAFVAGVEVAGPGFINFKVKDKAFAEQACSPLVDLPAKRDRRVMVEYTDPNPFKVFHIGHLMSNAIGESISRLVESDGAQVIRACYQGDVGLHVAKTIWAIIRQEKEEGRREKGASVTEKVKWLGEMYVKGSQYDDDPEAQKEIAVINKKVFEKSDPQVNEIYKQGRKWSLEYFDLVYKRLGTEFKQFFFESEVADDGMKVVKDFLAKGVFAESDGAVVFKGEDHGLHTRVFITSQGLPTYEAKEIGLNIEKFRKYPDLDESIIITANEQSDYFKVLLKAFSLIDTNIYQKTRHISHGIMRFASGKMSSRKGNIVPAETLIDDIKQVVLEKMKDSLIRESAGEKLDEIADVVAIGAIKYSILRQATGGDVIFDSASSISFEGDSGPYLQYATVRARSILEKARAAGMSVVDSNERFAGEMPEAVTHLEKLLCRFDDVQGRARAEYAPQVVAQYLMALAGAFNGYYAQNQILNEKDTLSPYRLALTKRFVDTMTRGLWLLGIKVPERM